MNRRHRPSTVPMERHGFGDLPAGARLELLGAATSDLRAAHAVAFGVARADAAARRDGAFLLLGILPTFLLEKC